MHEVLFMTNSLSIHGVLIFWNNNQKNKTYVAIDAISIESIFVTDKKINGKRIHPTEACDI